MSLLKWPWEDGKEPYFINKEGFHWYFDSDVTEACRKENVNNHPPLKAIGFIVAEQSENGEIVPKTRVLIDTKTNDVIAEETNLEALFVKIDMLRAQLHFNQNTNDT